LLKNRYYYLKRAILTICNIFHLSVSNSDYSQTYNNQKSFVYEFFVSVKITIDIHLFNKRIGHLNLNNKQENKLNNKQEIKAIAVRRGKKCAN